MTLIAHMAAPVRDAATALRLAPAEQRGLAIAAMAEAVRAHSDAILAANAEDMEGGREKGLSPAMLDRLLLDEARVEGIAASLDSIAAQDDPVGHVLETWTRPNGLRFEKTTTPIGVIGMIYESRPNVTADAAALCVRSANAVVLRSGSEALRSSKAIHAAVVEGLRCADLPEAAVQACFCTRDNLPERPSRARPRATAPEETRRTLASRSATSAASEASQSVRRLPESSTRRDDPTFTTTLRRESRKVMGGCSQASPLFYSSSSGLTRGSTGHSECYGSGWT